jgi:DNA-binding CsgD family transcriptional regulator
VLQRVMPGIASLGRRRSYRARHSATDDLLAAAWTVIRTYPIDRRPHYVAAGLLRSIGYAAADPMERRKATFVARPSSTFDLTAAVDPAPNASDELADLLTLAASAGVSADDVELVRRLGQGASTLQLASERQVSDRTIRNHRAAAVHRLRAVATSVA